MASFKLKKNQNPFLTGALIRPRVPRPRYGGNRTGVPAGFQARVGKHLFDKIRRKIFPFAHPGFQFAHPAML